MTDMLIERNPDDSGRYYGCGPYSIAGIATAHAAVDRVALARSRTPNLPLGGLSNVGGTCPRRVFGGRDTARQPNFAAIRDHLRMRGTWTI